MKVVEQVQRLVTECVQRRCPINSTSGDKLCYLCFQKPPVVAPRVKMTHLFTHEAVKFLSNCPKQVNLDVELFLALRRRITTRGQRANQRPDWRCQISKTTCQPEDKSNRFFSIEPKVEI